MSADYGYGYQQDGYDLVIAPDGSQRMEMAMGDMFRVDALTGAVETRIAEAGPFDYWMGMGDAGMYETHAEMSMPECDPLRFYPGSMGSSVVMHVGY